MASNLLPLASLPIAATAVDTKHSDVNRRRSVVRTTVNGKWWTPLFGMSAEADYIDGGENNGNNDAVENAPARVPAKYTPGCFTEEKAKLLRMRTKESFHDVMYHSAIASRLASDFSGHGDGH
ncbi:uncharacterized protein LOC141608262 [Silene latifolia]|uniref:uncharacterized protein LOC141608262 n=1 Tax=Silene latifolia TaxID=37657 RepID=UPI003D78A705